MCWVPGRNTWRLKAADAPNQCWVPPESSVDVHVSPGVDVLVEPCAPDAGKGDSHCTSLLFEFNPANSPLRAPALASLLCNPNQAKADASMCVAMAGLPACHLLRASDALQPPFQELKWACTRCPSSASSRTAAVTSTPAASTVCSGHGACYAQALSSAGICSCTGNYSGAACDVAPGGHHRPPHHTPTSNHLAAIVVGCCVCGVVLFVAAVFGVRRARRSPRGRYSGLGRGAGDANAGAVPGVGVGAGAGAGAGTALSQATSPLLGAQLMAKSPIKGQFVIAFDQVVIGQRIASGAGGTVYQGSYLGNAVALKQVHCGSGSEAKGVLQEVALLGNVHHPFIVRMFGAAFRPPSDLFIVTELCSTSLFNVLANPRLPVPTMAQRVRWLLQVAYGMAFLHERHILHRDLKPGNVLLDDTRTAKICDFGLARVAEGSRSQMTGYLGTVQYMAPETMKGRKARYGESVDVFSFGIVMREVALWQLAYLDTYAAASGASSSSGSGGGGAPACSLFQLRDQVLNGRRPTVPSAAVLSQTQGLPELVALAQRCWDADPAARPPFSAVVEELESVAMTLQVGRVMPPSMATEASVSGL